jgi:outer membrane lipoprotein-sorting protein
MMPLYLCLALAAIGLIFFSACQNLTSSGELSAPDERAVTRFAQNLYQKGQSLTSFAVRGQARYKSGAEDSVYNFELVAKRPDSYICTFFDPLGRPAFKVVNSKGVLKALNYGERIFYEAKNSDKELSELLPIPLTNRDFLDIFSASLPEAPNIVSAQSSLGFEEQSSISYRKDSRTLPITAVVFGGPSWNTTDALVMELISGREASPDYRVEYSGYHYHPLEDGTGGSFPFPSQITLTWSSFTYKTLVVSVEDVRLGFPLDNSFFTMEMPQGFTLERI